MKTAVHLALKFIVLSSLEAIKVSADSLLIFWISRER